MYGLKPSDIDALVHLRNTEITQICVGPSDIQFNFHPEGNISVWGCCELLDSSGNLHDRWQENTVSGIFRFPEVLMTPVIDVFIESSKSFVLKFVNGFLLRVIDNSQHYESFSVGELIV